MAAKPEFGFWAFNWRSQDSHQGVAPKTRLYRIRSDPVDTGLTTHVANRAFDIKLTSGVSLPRVLCMRVRLSHHPSTTFHNHPSDMLPRLLGANTTLPRTSRSFCQRGRSLVGLDRSIPSSWTRVNFVFGLTRDFLGQSSLIQHPQKQYADIVSLQKYAKVQQSARGPSKII